MLVWLTSFNKRLIPLAEDSLEGRTNSAYNEQFGQGSDNDLSDKVSQEYNKQASNPKKKSLFKRILTDTLKFSPYIALNVGLCALMGAPHAAFLTAIGLPVGRYVANKKKKKKGTYEEYTRQAKLGMWGATLALAAYTIPDYIFGSPVSLIGKIAKTLFFDTTAIPAWLLWYRTFNYITEKHGTKGLWKSFLNFKIFKHIKEAYQNDLKTKYLPQVKETFLTLTPIHFFSLNYIAQPWVRLAIGTGNDVLVAMIAGEEGLLKSIQKKFKPAYQKFKQKYFTPKSSYGGYSYQPT